MCAGVHVRMSMDVCGSRCRVCASMRAHVCGCVEGEVRSEVGGGEGVG